MKLLEKLESLASEYQSKADAIRTTLKELSNGQTKTEQIIRSIKVRKYSYKGKHWTQLPENKDRLRKMVMKSAKSRNKNA